MKRSADGRRFTGTGVGRGRYLLRARCKGGDRLVGSTSFEVDDKGIGYVRGGQGARRVEIRLAVNEAACRPGASAPRRAPQRPRTAGR